MSSFKNLFSTPIEEFIWDRSLAELDNIKSLLNNQPISSSKEFVSWALECSGKYAKSVGKFDGYLVCMDIWNRTLTNVQSYVPPHIHPNTWAVGCFYFEEGQGDLVLIDPRGYLSDWNWTEVADIDGHQHSSCTDYYYTPKKNTGIMFPGYIKHLVLPSGHARNRTAISWNILFEENLDTIKKFGVEEHRYVKI